MAGTAVPARRAVACAGLHRVGAAHQAADGTAGEEALPYADDDVVERQPPARRSGPTGPDGVRRCSARAAAGVGAGSASRTRGRLGAKSRLS